MIFDKWKIEWWLNHAAELALLHQDKLADITKKFEAEIDSQTLKNRQLLNNLQLEEEELEYRIKTVKERIIEMTKRDNELREQIRLLEAKASPSSVWCEAFTQGMNKAWDLMLPTVIDNVEKLKTKIREDATREAIDRLNGKRI